MICSKSNLLASWTHWNATILFPLRGYWRESYWGSGIYCITHWSPCHPELWSHDPREASSFVSISILNLWHMHLELWIGIVIIFNLNKYMQVNESSFFMYWDKKTMRKKR